MKKRDWLRGRMVSLREKWPSQTSQPALNASEASHQDANTPAAAASPPGSERSGTSESMIGSAAAQPETIAARTTPHKIVDQRFPKERVVYTSEPAPKQAATETALSSQPVTEGAMVKPTTIAATPRSGTSSSTAQTLDPIGTGDTTIAKDLTIRSDGRNLLPDTQPVASSSVSPPKQPSSARKPTEAENYAFAQIISSLLTAQNSCPVHETCDSSCPRRIGITRYQLSPSGVRSQEVDMRAQLALATPHTPLPVRTEPLAVSHDVPKLKYTTIGTQMIRLLKIKPAVLRADPVDCEIVDFELAKAPAYGALSYCWGTGPDDRNILCNGQVFHARTSLEHALKRLRAGFGSSQETYIWADAICINQQNEIEKSEQILLMEQIYSKASTVYVDLGGVEGDSISFGGFTLQFSGPGPCGLGQQDTLSMTDDPAHPFHFRTAFYALAKPWFTRTWIIQEIVLARKAKYIFQGNVFTPQELDAILSKDAVRAHPERFKELMSSNISMRGYLNYQKIQTIREAYQAGRKDSLMFMQLTRDFVATEPKDKIYGLMAILSGEDRAAIGPYSQSVQLAYQRFAAMHVRRGRTSTMLDSAGIHRKSLPGLQSWVPDWTSQSGSPKIISTLRPVPYSASGTLAAQVELLGDNGSKGLKLRGLLIDHLDSVTPFTPPSSAGDSGFLAYHQRIRTAFDTWLRNNRSIYINSEDAFARTLLMDDTYTGRNAILYSSPILDPASTYRSLLNNWPTGANAMARGQRMNAVETFQMQATTACLGRSFAVTKRGYIALMPPVARVGDVVAVIMGATVPYVLRRVEGGAEYLLVGDAYVHGVMYGEAVQRRDLAATNIVLV